MTGEVDTEGTPFLRLNIANQDWIAIIDTGFNGDLELPLELQSHLQGLGDGLQESVLAGGRRVFEEMFLIEFPFDDESIPVRAHYSPVGEILIGTGLIADYKLEIDFPSKTVQLTRLQGP